MKQFTRRSSQKQHQTARADSAQQQHNNPAVAAAARDPDPYAFLIEEGEEERQGARAQQGQHQKVHRPAAKATAGGSTRPGSTAESSKSAAAGTATAGPSHQQPPGPSGRALRPRASPVKAAEAAPAPAPAPAAPAAPAGAKAASKVPAAAASQQHKAAIAPAGTECTAAAAPPAAAAPRGAAGPGSSKAAGSADHTADGGGSSKRGRAPAPAAPAGAGAAADSAGTAAASGGGRGGSKAPAVSGVKRPRLDTSTAQGSQQQPPQQPPQQAPQQPLQQPPQQPRQQPPQQPPASGAAGSRAAAAAGAASAVTLPTPHRRARPAAAGLLGAAAAAAAAAGEARPAQTVMEAQERGEQVQMQDDARYAMDGLAPSCSIDTQRDSAATLAEMLSTRRGRTALRCEGLAQQFLTSLAKAKAGRDPVLALAASLALLGLAAEDANPCYLKSVAAAVLMDQLLQHDYSFDEVTASGAAGSKLCRLVRARPLVGVLATAGVSSTRGLLCIMLEQATSSQQASKAAAVEKLKDNLRQHGGLTRLAGLVADSLAAPGGALASARQLHLLLLVLENATFTCPGNGAALVACRVVPGGKGGSASKGAAAQQQGEQQGGAVSFPAALVRIAQQLQGGLCGEEQQAQATGQGGGGGNSSSSEEGGSVGAALHVALSVLMNLSHQNPEGGEAVAAAGGLEVAAATLCQLLQPAVDQEQEGQHGQDGQGGQHGQGQKLQQQGQQALEPLCRAVLQHLELLSVSLGLLINLVSGSPQHSRELAALEVDAGAGRGSSCKEGGADGDAAPGSGAAGSSGGGRRRGARATASSAAQQQQQQQGQDAGAGGSGSSLVALLCTVMRAVGQLRQQHDAGGDAAMLQEQQQQPGPAHSPRAAAAAAAAGSPAGSPAGLGQAGSPGSPPGVVLDAGGEAGLHPAGEASIVEVYCGMLLGFLVRDGPAALAAGVAARLAPVGGSDRSSSGSNNGGSSNNGSGGEGGGDVLPPGGPDGGGDGRGVVLSLAPVTGAVARCLEFYVSTGAITDHTRTTLEALLQHLAVAEAGLPGGGGGGDGGDGGGGGGSPSPRGVGTGGDAGLVAAAAADVEAMQVE